MLLSPGIQAEDSPRAQGAFWNIWGRQFLSGPLEREEGGMRSLPDKADFFLCADAAGRRTEWEQCVQLH